MSAHWQVAGLIAACVIATRPVVADMLWESVRPAPTSQPGFLGVPDDSKAGPVFQCVSAACKITRTMCTARIDPYKPEIWVGRDTRFLASDSEDAVIARYGFLEDDTDRLLEGYVFKLSMARLLPPRQVDIGGHVVVFTGVSDAIKVGAHMFTVAVWLRGDQLHRSVCYSQSGATDAEAERDVRSFLAFLSSHDPGQFGMDRPANPSP